MPDSRRNEWVKIRVFGAGAIGGWLAGDLAGSGIDVSVAARSEHLRAIRSDGLTVETPNSSVTSRPRASYDPAELGVQDAVIEDCADFGCVGTGIGR